MKVNSLNSCKKSELLLNAQEFAVKIIEGLNSSVTPFHYTEWAKALLLTAGFSQLSEKDYWNLNPGRKYFLIKNMTSLFIFTIGEKVNIKELNFIVVGGHTDSPSLRFAPNAFIEDNTYEKFNLQTYGGGQWQTWFDRDLGLAGKLVVENTETKKLETRLLKIEEPILFVPNLCIHLRTDKDGFSWNNEKHLKAISSTTFFDSTEDENGSGKDVKKETKDGISLKNNTELSDFEKKVGKKLAKLISSEIKTPVENIIDYDLILYDTNKARLTGLNKEFISSERFDNLGTSITGVHAMIESSVDLKDSASINICSLFDSEEIGSQTFQGAMSTYFKDTITRIFSSIAQPETLNNQDFNNYFQAACSRSLILSTDMAHLYHPNYSEYYQSEHRPLPNHGPCIKINCNAKYSSESEGISIIKYIAKKNQLPIQDFIVRQDSPCGTTIGPIIAGKCGIRAIDIGCPQLAMHSIREQTACLDLYNLKQLFVAFYKDFSEVSEVSVQ